tara:strand:- start:2678 stop:3256 length:579 start_codon:yes stop_codon:yes gene_type:complete
MNQLQIAIDRPWKLLSNWIEPALAKNWKEKIHNKLSWQQPVVRVFGKDHLVPRQTVFLGEEGIKYRYSGLTHSANGWPSWFYPLLKLIREESHINFNGCLINLYKDGSDRMGWHSDNEKEIDSSKPIYSLSLGVSREFYLKHRRLNIKHKLTLGDGDLLIMYPGCQEAWLHSVPKRTRVIDSRINLTFRYYC